MTSPDQQIRVCAYPAGTDLFWIECTECGPVELVDHDSIAPISIGHLNEHGCEIQI